MLRFLYTCALCVFLSACDRGGITQMAMFESTFEDNEPFKGWAIDQHCCKHSLRVSDEQSTDGRKSLRLEVRKSDPKTSKSIRSELVLKPDQPGSIRWYGFNMYLEDWIDDNAGEHVFQWHPNNLNGTATAALWTSGGRFVFQTNAGGSAKNVYHDLGPIISNEWISWIIHVKWVNDNSGFLQVWKNGELMIDRKNFISCPPEGSYFKLGINKFGWLDQSSTTERRVLYFDEVRIGDERVNFEMVNPTGQLTN